MPALARRLDGIPLVEDNKPARLAARVRPARRMRWYAGRRGNDQVAHYFAADRCVKEPVCLGLESTRPLATARSAGLAGETATPLLHHPPGHDPDLTPGNPMATYVAILGWRSDAPPYPQFFSPFA